MNSFSRSSSAVLSPPVPRLFLRLYCSNCGKTDADFNFGTRAGGERHQIPQKHSQIHGNMEISISSNPFVFSGAVHLCRPGDSGDKTNHSDAQLPERQSNPPDLGTAVTQIDTICFPCHSHVKSMSNPCAAHRPHQSRVDTLHKAHLPLQSGQNASVGAILIAKEPKPKQSESKKLCEVLFDALNAWRYSEPSKREGMCVQMGQNMFRSAKIQC